MNEYLENVSNDYRKEIQDFLDYFASQRDLMPEDVIEVIKIHQGISDNNEPC